MPLYPLPVICDNNVYQQNNNWWHCNSAFSNYQALNKSSLSYILHGTRFDTLQALSNGKASLFVCATPSGLSNNLAVFTHLYAFKRGPLGHEKMALTSILPVALFVKISAHSLNTTNVYGFTFNSSNKDISLLSCYRRLTSLFSLSTRDGFKLFDLVSTPAISRITQKHELKLLDVRSDS